jgi:hypothetical protein
MPYGVSIPVTHDSECTSYYQVQIKKDFETQWATLPNQFASPILIQDLDPSTNYNIRVRRFCCNGQQSNLATVNITTGA